MSFSTFSGVLFSLGLFFAAIKLSTDNWAVFFSLTSFMMVFGGSLARTFIAYEMRNVLHALKCVLMIMAPAGIARDVLKTEVGRIIKWGYAAQKDGVSTLEYAPKKKDKKDAFLIFGLGLARSEYSGEEIRNILANTIETAFKRETEPVKALNSLAASAPAFGLVGTLVGVVIMLGKMNGDPAALAKGLALAMITTLYGLILAQLIYKPTADKILRRAQTTRLHNYLVADGLGMLAERRSPRFIKDKMNSYLDPAFHFSVDMARPPTSAAGASLHEDY